MSRVISIILSIVLISSAAKSQEEKNLAHTILTDENIQQVDSMARKLMKKGFYAGSGYQMVWARDLKTFIELSCQEYDQKIIRENLLMFFHFQQTNGELLKGGKLELEMGREPNKNWGWGY